MKSLAVATLSLLALIAPAAAADAAPPAPQAASSVGAQRLVQTGWLCVIFPKHC